MALVITRTELIARARSAVHPPAPKTTYRLGAGHTLPEFDSPAGTDGACDCSNFICWVLNLNKFDRSRTWLEQVNGGYLNTDGIWWDAVKTELGLFNMVGWIDGSWSVPVSPPARSFSAFVSMQLTATKALPGDLIVYPAAWVVRGARLAPPRVVPANPAVGHVMLIVDPIPDASGKPLIIDCSAAVHDNAIREHRWFPTHPAAVVARCSLVTD